MLGFLFRLAVAAFSGAAGLAAYTVYDLHRRPRRTLRDNYFITPYELQIPFEKVQFETSDGVQLRGWFLSHKETERVVIGFCGREGSKDDLIGIGTALWRSGLNVLLFDYRGRGESQRSGVSVGEFELQDAIAACKYALSRIPNARSGLLGYSMGASLAIQVAAHHLKASAVVADSPFITLKAAIAANIHRFYLPGTLIASMADWLNQKLYGYPLDRFDQSQAAYLLAETPVLLIHGEKDSRIPVSHSRAIQRNLPGKSDLWIAPGADHCGAYFVDREAYSQRVAQFFQESFGP